MSNPWDDYAGTTAAPPASSEGPWSDYAAPSAKESAPWEDYAAPKITAQELAQRDHSEIFQHAAQNPDDFETAYQADKLRRALPFTAKAGEFISSLPGAVVSGVKGVGNFVAGAVETPLHAFQWWKSPETRQAENTLAAQHGEQSITNAINAVTNARPSTYAGGWGENTGEIDASTPEQRAADEDTRQRAIFSQRVQQAKNEIQLATGRPLDTGAIAAIYHAAGQQPSEEVGPEALKGYGVAQADPGTVARMSAASDPTILALAAAPGLPGAATLGGGAAELAGKAIQVPGRVISSIPGRLGHLARGNVTPLAAVEAVVHPAAAAGTAASVAGAKGLQALGRVIESQGKELRTGVPSELTTRAATAEGTGQSALGTNIARKVGDTVAHGASTAVGMAPLNATLSEGDPKALAESTVGAGVFGGAFGALARNRPMLVEAIRPHLQSEGARALAEAGEGNDPLAIKSAAYVMSLPEEARNRTLEAIGALQGLPTNTPEGPKRAKLYVLNDSDYRNVIAEKIGMEQAAMGGGRGFFIADDGAAYVNGDYHSGLAPSELAHTIGHEFGGHAAVNVMQAAGAKGGALYQGLINAAKEALMPGGRVTPGFYRFVREYNQRFDPTGQTQRLDFNNPESIEEFLAEQAGQLMAAKGAGELAIPKNIQDRISDGIGRFMGEMLGIDTRKVGTETHFGREEVGQLSQAVQDTLGQVVGMKLRGGAEIPEPAKTSDTRIAELNQIIAKPRPPTSAPVEAMRAWLAEQKAARKELADLQPTPATTFPAAGAPPVAPSAPGVPPTAPAPTGGNRARVAAALRLNGIPSAEAAQWAQQAQGATTEEMILDALKRRAAQKFPTQTPVAPTPTQTQPVENQPTDLPPAANAPTPPNEAPAKSSPEVNLPPVTTETATIPERSPASEDPAPISEDSIGEIAAQAEAAVTAARAGTKKKAHTAAKEISDAQVDAVAAAHEQSVPANYQGVKMRTDATGKRTISGTFNPSRPFDAFLLKLADLSQKHVGILQDLQSKIGHTVTVNYGHAPAEEGEVTSGARKAAQAASSAQERAAGESPQQNEDKNFIPLEVRFNKGKDTPSITVLGASPEKLLNNFNLAGKAVTELGREVPYRDIHDPHLVADMKQLAQNHANGYRFDGKPIESFPDQPVAQTPGFKPNVIPVERFEFLNLMLGDESAKTGKKGTSPDQQLKQGLAAKNQIPMTEAGETNMLRESINRAKGPVGDTTWSKATIENPLSEALRVDLINEVKPEISNEDASIREHGYKGDISRFFGEGSPNRTFTAAGFMPDVGIGPAERAESDFHKEMASKYGGEWWGPGKMNAKEMARYRILNRATSKEIAESENPSEHFHDWDNAEHEDGKIQGYRGESGTGGNDSGLGDFKATEGVGPYIAKSPDTAGFFGKVRTIAFDPPKRPLVVNEEPLHILSETDEIMDPVKPGDSDWTRLNKLAVKNAGVTDDNWGSKTEELNRQLTREVMKAGYDAVLVKSGGDEWTVLLQDPDGKRVQFMPATPFEQADTGAPTAQERARERIAEREKLPDTAKVSPQEAAKQRLSAGGKSAPSFMPDDSTKPEEEGVPSSQRPSGQQPDRLSTEGTSTNKPVTPDQRKENLMEEAEAAGLAPSLELMKSVIRGDRDAMDKLRRQILDRTGRPAKWMPSTSTRPNSKEAARARIQSRLAVPAQDDRKRVLQER